MHNKRTPHSFLENKERNILHKQSPQSKLRLLTPISSLSALGNPNSRTTHVSKSHLPLISSTLGSRAWNPAQMPPVSRARLLAALFVFFTISISVRAQDGAREKKATHASPQDSCIGVFLTYTFISRIKEYPRLKNASAQSYAFDSRATVLNTMAEDLKAWEMHVGFQHEEILVSVSGAVVSDGTDFPMHVGNGTSFTGSPQTDLMNAIDTAGDMTQIQATIEMKGTQFGVKSPGIPMPKTIKLLNDGFKCPAPTRKGSQMHVCCVKDPKLKANKTSTKLQARRTGDLTIGYDVLQAYENNYLAQVTIDNLNPIGRLDNWNLTWEWARGEFIYSMKGAYTLRKDYSDCIYGQAGSYYQNFDFSKIMNCEKRPVITDLPPEREKDQDIGNIPYCCKNGTLLPPTMDPSKARAIFQLQVYKMPPDLNRTALYPPEYWKIKGFLNPDYKCGAPIKVSPTEFPDSTGLMSETEAIASWQVVCNITRPKRRNSKCCVSYSAYYNASVVPCNTCACGCSDSTACDPNARPLLLPPEGLLVPFDNRTAKAKAWAEIKHRKVPNPLPCGDNCGVSLNWHIVSNYKDGWTARITLFNWDDYIFKNWSMAVRMDQAYLGFDRAYAFNGTKLNGTKLTDLHNTIFFQGLVGLNYLMPEQDGKNPEVDPRVPGKQQSVISFKKKETPGIEVLHGDGFPKRVYFNGEECALPDELPISEGFRHSVSLLSVLLVAVMVVVTLTMEDCWR